MKLNLDSLKTEIASYLNENGFILFHGFSRSFEEVPEVEWDSVHYPDYRSFLDVARQLGVRLVVLHHREFSSTIIDRATDELPSSGFEYQEQRQFEQRLKELAIYDGFTCLVELSFEHAGTLYVFELRTDWYNQLNSLLEEMDMATDVDETGEDEGENPLGGYYSKN
jgi:hypothetical protein